jgi:hypothetical protein
MMAFHATIHPTYGPESVPAFTAFERSQYHPANQTKPVCAAPSSDDPK